MILTDLKVKMLRIDTSIKLVVFYNQVGVSGYLFRYCVASEEHR